MIKCDVKYHDMDMPRLKLDPCGDWVDVRASVVAIDGEPAAWIPWPSGEYIVGYTAGQSVLIRLGFSMAFPEFYEAHVLPRSSLFKKAGLILVNGMGLIDHCYCGNGDEWLFPAHALRDGYLVRHQRIGQFRLMKRMPPVEFREVSVLYGRDRGGYGSTDPSSPAGFDAASVGGPEKERQEAEKEEERIGESFRVFPGCKRSWIVD